MLHRLGRALLALAVLAASASVVLPRLSGDDAPGVRIALPTVAAVGDVVTLEVATEHLAVRGFEIVARTDGDALVPVGASIAGSDFGRHGSDLSVDAIDGAVLAGATDPAHASSGTLGSLRLEARAPGQVTVAITAAPLVDAAGRTSTATAVATIDIVADRDDADDRPPRDVLAAPQPAAPTTTTIAPTTAPTTTAPARSGPAVPPSSVDDGPAGGALTTAAKDEVRLDYQADRITGACTASASDLDGDGCVTVADVALAVAAPTAARSAGTGGPAVYVVDTTSDAPDWGWGDGICATQTGACSLRAALAEAQLQPGDHRIEFDIPGPAPAVIALTRVLPTISDTTGTLVVDGYTQPGSAPNTHPTAFDGIPGVEITGGGTTSFDAFRVTSDGNHFQGLSVYGVRRPFWLDQASDTTFTGNLIGTDATGSFASTPVSFTAHGIHVAADSARTIVGGTDVAERNVISGNAAHGVAFYHANSDDGLVINNLVGLGPDGTAAVPNGGHGIDVNFGASNTRIGGLDPGERNVIAGNVGSGIEISHQAITNDTHVVGNWIGTAHDGLAGGVIGNNHTGVYIEDGVTNTLVEHNVVADNRLGGIAVFNNGSNGTTVDTVIRDNEVVLNRGPGVEVNGDRTTVGPGNVITDNVGAGVVLTDLAADQNTITQNSTVDNGGLGIDLAPVGVANPNDAQDADAGANGKLNFPEVTRATTKVLEGTACADCIVEVFLADEGEGVTFVETLTASPAGDFAGDVLAFGTPFAIGDEIVLTATDPAGNTSEFSPTSVVIDHNDPPSLVIDTSAGGAEGDTVTVTLTASDPDGDAFVVDWDLDDDGVFETPGDPVDHHVVLDLTPFDGPGDAAVAARATDARGEVATTTGTVPVTNAPPIADASAPATSDEGTTFDVTVTGDDPSDVDDTDLRYAVDCDGGDLSGVLWADAATDPVASCPTPNGPDSLAVTAAVVDRDDAVATTTVSLDAVNVAPTPQIDSLPATVAEGTAFDASGSATDPSADDEAAGFVLDWTEALDGAPTAPAGTGTTVSIVPTDDGVLTVGLSATDVDGSTGGPVTDTVVVTNVAPTATFDSDATTEAEGIEAVVRLLNPADPSTADVAAGLRAAFDCDGGSLAGTTWATASTDLTTTCQWTDGLTDHDVRARIIDDDGGFTEYLSTVTTGDDQPPTVSTAALVTVDEGGTVALTATGEDPEGGELTYNWDLDGDGTFETPGQDVTFDAAALDGPLSVPIAVRATDVGGLNGQATATVDVVNVAPTGTTPAVSTDEAAEFTVEVPDGDDASTDDAAALRYAFDCDGASLAGVVWADADPTPSTTCTIDDGPATVGVSVRILDDDGGVLDLVADVDVANVDPTIEVLDATTPVDETGTIEVNGAADDVSTADAASLVTTWELLDDAEVVLASGTGLAVSVDAPDDGPHVVRLHVADGDGGTASVDAAIDVVNVDPTGTLEVPATAKEGGVVDVSITMLDDDEDDLADLRFAFGCDGEDLSALTYDDAGEDAATTCTMPDDGLRTVTARVFDDDGGSDDLSETIDVAGVAPTMAVHAPDEIHAGTTFDLAVTDLADAGPDDEAAGFEVAFDCGTGLGAFAPASATTCPALATAGIQDVAAVVRDADGLERAVDLRIVVQANRVSNGSAEVDGDGDGVPDGWTWHPNAALDPVEAADGTRSIALLGDGTARQAYVFTTFAVPFRSQVDTAVAVRAVGDGTATVNLRFYGAGGSNIATFALGSVTDTAGAWIDLARSDMIPAGAVSARVDVLATATTGTIHIDDVRVHHRNLVVNDGFEVDAEPDGWPDEWTRISRFSQDTATALEGAATARFDGDGSVFVPSQFLPVVHAGVDYDVSLRLLVPSGVPSSTVARLQVRWYGPSGPLTTVLVDKAVGPTEVWTQLFGTVTAPAGATTARLEIKWLGLVDTAWADEAQFTAR